MFEIRWMDKITYAIDLEFDGIFTRRNGNFNRYREIKRDTERKTNDFLKFCFDEKQNTVKIK